MKRIIVSVLTLILTLSVGLFVACAPQQQTETEVNLTLNKTSLTVEKYMNAFIIADYDGSGKLTWTSANEGIATVEDGRVYGVAVGDTTVTVTDGTLTASCSVTVGNPDPAKFAISAGGDFSMFLGAQKTLTPIVTYNNVPVQGTTFKFSTDSTNISLKEGGVIIANAIGEAVVKVESEVDGNAISTEIIVDVQDEYSVEVQQSNVVLYPFDSYDGVKYNNTIVCTANVLKAGEPISVSASEIKWSVPKGQDVIKVDENGKVTALNGGSAALTAAYTVDGKTVVGEIIITVAPVEVVVEDVVLEAGLSTPYKPEISDFVEVYDEVSKILVDSYGLDEVEILPDGGAFDLSALNSGAAHIKLVTRNFSYLFEAVIYDGVIANAEEMKALLKAEGGMYKIVADIDMADYVADGVGEDVDPNLWTSTVAFNGTIDGGDHVIRNFKTNTGLFKQFNGGQIKNIAFTDVVTVGAIGLFGDYNRAVSTPITVDNAYVSFSTNSGGWYVGLFGSMNLREPLNINNTVIVSSDKLGYGAVVGRIGSYAINLNNCYLIKTSLYRASLNTNLSEEEQQKLHNPATNEYKTFATATDAYIAYMEEPFAVNEFVGGMVEELMSGYAQEILLLSNENVADLLTFTGKTILLTEDIDMATAYTDNGGVWTSTLDFFGTFEGNGYTIKNLKTNTGLFGKFNGYFQNVNIEDVIATGNAGVIAKSYARTGVSNVWVDNITVNLAGKENGCDWYFGLFGSVNIGSPIYLTNVYFRSDVPGRAYIYGEVGSGAIDMQNCWFVGLAKEYARSLNTNLDAEGQRKLHLPEKNDYHFFATSHDMYYDYINNEYTFDGLMKDAIEEYMAEFEGHERVLKSDDSAHWYECSCGFVYAQSKAEHYGSASCTETGNCELCGHVYGGAHVYDVLACDQTDHWYNCKWCGLPGEKQAHFGGKATCTEQAKCEVCGTPHGELHNYTVLKFDQTHHWYKCEGCDLTTEKVEHFGGVASTTEKAKCEVCHEPYGELKPSYVTITSANVKELLTAVDGTYYLAEDIDMATAYTENGGIWASKADFNGVIDGQGHTIYNLNTTGNNSGLFNRFAGTFRNISLVDVTTTGQTGALAYQTISNAKLSISNVAIIFKTGNVNYLAAGLFRQMHNQTSNVTLENVFIYVPTTNNQGNGTVAGNVNIGSPAPTITFSNCYFVGYKNKVNFGGNIDLSTKEGYTAYADKSALADAYFAGSITLPEALEKHLQKVIDIKTITSANVKDLLTATEGVYMITEDIDMATAYTENGGVWASSVEFKGSLYGGEHTIKNFKTSSGLFKTLLGAVKDIAFVDAETSLACGLIAYGTTRNSTSSILIENVYISFKSAPTGYLAGGIFRSLNLGSTKCVVKDCYVYIPGTASNGNAVFTGSLDDSTTSLTLENCYFVGLNGKFAFNGNSASHNFGGYKTYADINAFNADTSKTLTDFMTKNLAK